MDPKAVEGQMSPPAVITDFRGDYHFLSNFYRCPIKQGDLTFPTVEHAFQAAKCLDRKDKLGILAVKNPGDVKRHGRRVPLRPDWEQVKLDIMHELLSVKFAAGGPLHSLLLATGDADLVEGNGWHDDFWGSCDCAKHRATDGLNHLGKLLMRVREELRSN